MARRITIRDVKSLSESTTSSSSPTSKPIIETDDQTKSSSSLMPSISSRSADNEEDKQINDHLRRPSMIKTTNCKSPRQSNYASSTSHYTPLIIESKLNEKFEKSRVTALMSKVESQQYKTLLQQYKSNICSDSRPCTSTTTYRSYSTGKSNNEKYIYENFSDDGNVKPIDFKLPSQNSPNYLHLGDKIQKLSSLQKSSIDVDIMKYNENYCRKSDPSKFTPSSRKNWLQMEKLNRMCNTKKDISKMTHAEKRQLLKIEKYRNIYGLSYIGLIK